MLLFILKTSPPPPPYFSTVNKYFYTTVHDSWHLIEPYLIALGDQDAVCSGTGSVVTVPRDIFISIQHIASRSHSEYRSSKFRQFDTHVLGVWSLKCENCKVEVSEWMFFNHLDILKLLWWLQGLPSPNYHILSIYQRPRWLLAFSPCVSCLTSSKTHRVFSLELSIFYEWYPWPKSVWMISMTKKFIFLNKR